MRTTVVARGWESTFQSWGGPPNQSERDTCEHAERAIRKAIRGCDTLVKRNIDVLVQGSYRNRTNVREASDVDICVLCREGFFYDLPSGVTAAQLGFTNPCDYSYDAFKNDVHRALVSHFGSNAVTLGNKAFNIHENTYRIDADVVAAFEYRRYDRTDLYHEGTRFFPKKGGTVTNWPQQNYDNGVSKNMATRKRFKATARILKRLRNAMDEDNIAAATAVSSFLIESLVWNVPNEGFGHDTYKDDVRYAIAHLWNETRSSETCNEWGEINDLKYLFRVSQPWTREQAHAFLGAAWTYVGYQ